MTDRVVVAERESRFDAELLAGTLRGHGIDATVVGDDWDDPAAVVVPQADAVEAWDLIHPGQHVAAWSQRWWVKALAALLVVAMFGAYVVAVIRG